MWFKLAGATFTNNLGTMDSISKSYMMDYSGLTGLSASPGSVSYASDSTPDATITFTVKSGYVFKSGATVTASGGASKTYTASADIAAGSTFTLALTGITGKVTFSGAAELVSGGGSTGGGGVEDDDNTSGGGGTTTPGTGLDSIAYGSLTYRDIFITNNYAPDINNNSMTSSKGGTYVDSTGSTTIKSDSASADNYVPPYSLYVSGTSSQQAKSATALPFNTKLFLACNIKVTNYTKGYCGMIFGSQFGACANAVTDGWEVKSLIGDNTEGASSGTSLFFIGSASSANLTGYINNPVAVPMSIFTTAPTESELTALYNEYTALLIAGEK